MRLVPLLYILLSIITLFSGCGKKHEDISRKKNADTLLQQPTPFVPDSDSAISAGRMASWFRCNQELDSLSAAFTGSLAAENTPESFYKNLAAAQDRSCVKNGLQGGYNEYLWILQHVGSRKNKALYDSMRMHYTK